MTEHRPIEWARERNITLHGMSDERWGAYLRYLEGEDRAALADVHQRLADEVKDVTAALEGVTFLTPDAQVQRTRLRRGLRELRLRRMADLRHHPLAPKGDDDA